MPDMRDLRTPMGRVRGLGSAKSGTGHFIKQRVTAISNVVLIAIFIVLVVSLIGEPYEVVIERLGNPLISGLILLMLLSALLHMRIGMQVIIEDYVHDHGPRVACLVLNVFFPLAIGVASALAVLKLMLGM